MPALLAEPDEETAMNMKKVLTIAIGVLAAMAVIFGSIHIYSAAVARNTIEQTLNGMVIVGMAPIQRLEDPARFTYRVDLAVSNASRLTAEVKILSWEVQIDETVFDVTSLNDWQETIHPKDSKDTYFTPKGQITIPEAEIIDLKDKDIVPLILTGEIQVIASQAWVTESIVHEFSLESSVIFN